ncbi:hypothetical protein Tco_1138159 [Tanacetum coccineum]
MECKVGTLMEEAIMLMGRIESIFGISSDMMCQLPSEPSRQEAFEDLLMNFILDQEEKVKHLEEYMGVIGIDFMELSSEVVGKLKEEIRMEENRTKKIKKITRYPDTEDLEPLNGYKFKKILTEKASFHTPKFVSPKSSPQSTPQVLPSFEENTPPVTHPKEVEDTLGTPIEVEPFNETQLEDLGLNACNHDIPFSSREVPSFNETKAQPHPLPNYPPLDISLGEKTSLEPPIKPHSPDSFTMKEVDHLTNHTPPSPHVASFHPKDTYCYYHSCIGDPKKHYGFKPSLLGQSGSPCVDFLNMEMIENDWELESKEVSFLGRGLNLPVRPKEVENVRIKETHHLKHIIQQPIFQHVTPYHNNGVYRYYHPHLNSSVGKPFPLSVK